jgi:hypothetical protein
LHEHSDLFSQDSSDVGVEEARRGGSSGSRICVADGGGADGEGSGSQELPGHGGWWIGRFGCF